MITINPETPSSDDSIELVFTGGSMCFDASSRVEGNHFIFEITDYSGELPCLSAPIPYEIVWPVGRLRAGEYQATQIDRGEEIASVGFHVSQGELPFPASPIPSLGFAGVVLLVVALVWIANKALKRMPRSTA
jgi:hypothetical protein